MNSFVKLLEQQEVSRAKPRQLGQQVTSNINHAPLSYVDQNPMATILEDKHARPCSGAPFFTVTHNASRRPLALQSGPEQPQGDSHVQRLSTVNDEKIADVIVRHDLNDSTTTSTSSAVPVVRTRDHARETDITKGKKLAQETLSQLDQSVWKDSPERRQVVLTKLVSALSDELTLNTQDAALATDTLITNRLQASIQTLKRREVYNTNAGQALIHQVWQSLADPNIGADDPALNEIASRLGASKVSNVQMCFAERKEYGFGYVPPKKQRADALEEWLVAVPSPCAVTAESRRGIDESECYRELACYRRVSVWYSRVRSVLSPIQGVLSPSQGVL